ncbi:MAG TPA: aminoglycoside 6-adenylyltransferase [Candidatus Choladousia intestinavium]|uniref:Aminoglycoside 6-adenylyltransferase n=1 Tax=Candidatus Choladousia intestinavium TaxID=2840727 RepID=A0A9D1AGA3_9FIRM|nr:aminoglycoside 6-adenylyltransferase [Candidatus Choladousia intestinavium]
MRSEKEMLELIADTALADENIRAAYLEGSRANPSVPRDIFQDYDVVYIVKDTKPYRENRAWIDRFGERLYMQYPEENTEFPSDVENCYGWLMQLADGNRLDLHVCTGPYALARLELYQTLVDKDGIMPAEKEECDEMHWIRKPDERKFQNVCNEFWWCLNNVAKGLWREELPYVLDMMDFHVRPMLKQMLEWKIGCGNHFSVSAGKMAKYMKRFLPRGDYDRFLQTYGRATVGEQWQAAFVMCDLFQETACAAAETLGFSYNREEAENSRWFLEHVYTLPKDAREVIQDKDWSRSAGRGLAAEKHREKKTDEQVEKESQI